MLKKYNLFYRLILNSAYILTGLYFLYLCLGTLLGPYEYDEIYFLYESWITSNGNAFREFAATPIRLFFSKIWLILHGEVKHSWFFKFLIIIAAIIQTYCIFKSLIYIFNKYKQKILLSFTLSSAFISASILFRGFEIRPEVIGNTALIITAYGIIKLTNNIKINFFTLAYTTLFLTLGLSASTRHIIPIAIFSIFFYLLAYLNSKEKILCITFILIFILLNIYINVILFNFIEFIKSAKSFQISREPFNYSYRLITGSSIFYFVNLTILSITSLYLSLKVNFFKKDISFSIVASLLTIIYFYLFIYFFDIRPFEYIRSIEWSLTFILILFILDSLKNHSSSVLSYKIPILIIIGSFILICIEVSNLYRSKNNSYQTLMSLFYSKDAKDLRRLNDSDLIITMVSSLSILDQIQGRDIYCARYPKGIVIVDSWKFHPICLKDEGSLFLSGFDKNDLFIKNINYEDYQYISLFKGSPEPPLPNFYRIDSKSINLIFSKR